RDGDVESAETVVAVAQTGPGHGVRDEHDVPRVHGVEDHPHDVGRHMDAVGDELHIRLATRTGRERRGDGPAVAVVESRHPVEQVGDDRGTTAYLQDRLD